MVCELDLSHASYLLGLLLVGAPALIDTCVGFVLARDLLSAYVSLSCDVWADADKAT